MKVIAIIPVREFEDTKLRLRSSLSRDQRAVFTRTMLKHVLSELDRSCVDECIVVASKRKIALTLAKSFPKVSVIQESVHHGGVNAAMEDGIRYARKHIRGAGSVMLLPSDLPLLTKEAINQAVGELDSSSSKDLIIAPSLKRDGTSLLLFDLRKERIPLHYDDDSYNQHAREARRLKVKYSILRMKEFSFDVDSSEDLKKLMSSFRVADFEALIDKLDQNGRGRPS